MDDVNVHVKTAEDSDHRAPLSLEAAFQRAQSFPTARATEIVFPQIELQEHAKEETSFGRVDVDDRGLTAGMRLHLVQRVGDILNEWRSARAHFDQLLAPHLSKIESIDNLDKELTELQLRSDKEEAEIEHLAETDTKYTQIKERFDHAESRFKQKFAENDQRVPILWGTHPTYFVALAFTGIAELFINYDVFLRFLQVPAWAAATAVILGALLAFAAHGHGTLLKQWAFRFGPARTRSQRFTDWRLFALSTFGLLIVLTAAGASRYAAVMRLVGAAPTINLLGAEADIDVSPIRDVLISLLGNVGAWVVGVFWAYVGHDPDPEYMEAAQERKAARKLYNRRRKKLDAEKETVRARYVQDIAKKKNAAQTFLRDFEKHHELLVQVRERETAIVTQLQAALSNAAHRYRDALLQIVVRDPEKVVLVRGTDAQPVSAYEYKNRSIMIDPEFVRSLG